MGARAPEDLLGQPFNPLALKAFLSELDEAPKLDEFGGMQTRVYRRNGIDVHVSGSGAVLTIFLYGKRFEGHQPYKKTLPAGLSSFEASKADIIKRFGRPNRSGRKNATMPAWVRYELGAYVMHLEFPDEPSRIDRITLMTPGAAEGEM